jgi:hypothetical protein
MKKDDRPLEPQIVDEPGMAERFQRGLQRALSTPHQPHAPIKKRKERPASKGRAHKGKTRGR